jgi:hypothetical protein
MLARDLGLLRPLDAKDLLGQVDELGRMLNALRSRVEASARPSRPSTPNP